MQVISSRAGTRTPAAAVALATLGVAGGSWVVAIHQMDEMGSTARLGSLAFFAGLWMSMMAAMMLPGAIPAVSSRARARGRLRSAPIFLGSYLAVWGLVGLATYALYRPPGAFAVGVVVVAAGLYELTPVKQYFRQLCFERGTSGLQFGLCCVGSSIGLMAMLVVLGLMSVGWMCVITAIVLAQKLLAPKGAVDVPLGFGIVGLGILIILAPSSVPWLMTTM